MTEIKLRVVKGGFIVIGPTGDQFVYGTNALHGALLEIKNLAEQEVKKLPKPQQMKTQSTGRKSIMDLVERNLKQDSKLHLGIDLQTASTSELLGLPKAAGKGQ